MKHRIILVLALCVAMASGTALAAGTYLVTDAATPTEPSTQNPSLVISQTAPIGAETEYQEARQLLASGDFVSAINIFAKLGQYQDSLAYEDYIDAKLALLRNMPADAIAGFAEVGDFLDGAALKALAEALYCHRFQHENRFGYVDASGKILIEAQFDWAERVFRRESAVEGSATPMPVAAVFMGATACDGTDLLPQEGKYGLLRRDGELVAPLQYDEILWTVDGFAALRAGETHTLLNLTTGQPLGERYEAIGALREGFIPVQQGGKWGYLGLDGQMLPGGFAWDSALPFAEGVAGVSQEKRAGFIDATGQVVIPLQYDGVSSFGNGLAGFAQKKKWGFVNAQGEVVIKPAFQAVGVFTQDRCAVKRSNKWGIIDLQGKWVVPYKYDEITDFDPMYHRAWMRNNKLWGLLSLDGAVVLKPTWATFTPFGADGMSCVSYKGGYGFIDVRGSNRILSMYDSAAAFSANLGSAEFEGNLVQYLTRLGKSFTVVSNVPTTPLCGFIEGRVVKATTLLSQDPETGKELSSVDYEISFLLYDLLGNPIDIR